jgi:anti-sigma regulatory factor (Ser/Thr protein kinase)
MRFGRDLDAPQHARHTAAAVLRGWAIDGTEIDDVALIVSEIVTNAICHGTSGDVHMSIELGESALVVLVYDRTPFVSPFRAVRHADADEESGRGLALVEVLADRWGSGPVDGDPTAGTAVWAEIGLVTA